MNPVNWSAPSHGVILWCRAHRRRRRIRRGLMLLVVVSGPVLRAAEQPPGPFDNVQLSAGVGAEKLPGEAHTGFATLGADWGIPVTPPSGVALGLQLGGSVKLRDDDPEWNATVGGFGRNVTTFADQRGAVAMLFDYRHTALNDDLWAVRPIVGTTLSAADALGLEGAASLNTERREHLGDALTTFWTRGWNERLGTELGAGYEFRKANAALCRARVAVGLTRSIDAWCGGDANGHGDYAVGVGLSYRFGRSAGRAGLTDIGGSPDNFYRPFPTAEFPSLLGGKK